MKAKVELYGNRIRLSGSFNQWSQQPARVGGTWNPKREYWSFAKNLEICRKLRAEFGQELRIGPNLWAWAKSEKEREADLGSIAGMDMRHTVELDNVRELAPTMWKAMEQRGYQTVSALFGARAQWFLNADQQGLGKCIESLAAMIQRPTFGRVLIIAQSTPITVTWEPELEKWLSDFKGTWDYWTPGVRVRDDETIVTANTEQRKAKLADYVQKSGDADLAFCLVNPEMLRCTRRYVCPRGECQGEELQASKCAYQGPNHKRIIDSKFPELFDIEWDAIIADEVHRYILRSNPNARKPSQVGLGFSSLDVARDGMRIALTGTPMKGKPRNLWQIFHWLRPDVYTSQWKWSGSYLEHEDNRFSTMGITYLDKVREDAMPALDRELSTIMIRRTKKELRAINPEWAPPEKQYVTVPLRMGSQQAKQYLKMEMEGAVDLASGRIATVGVLSELRRLSQFAIGTWDVEDGILVPRLPSVKFEWLLTFLEGLGIIPDGKSYGEDKVVVASQYTKIINMYARELQNLGIGSFVLTGETPVGEKRAMVEAWQANRTNKRVFLTNIAAGGTSITLDSADYLVVNDETWVPDDVEQVEDRIHRTSRVDHQVTIYVPRVIGTVETDIIGPTNALKSDNNFRYLDAKRVSDWAKKKASK